MNQNNTDTLMVFSGQLVSPLNGLPYNVRYLLTQQEKAGLEQAGLLFNTAEVVGLQDHADHLIAGLEKQAHVIFGGQIQ